MNFLPKQKIRGISCFDTKDHTQHIVASSFIDEEINDECCLDAHKDSPHETILVTT